MKYLKFIFSDNSYKFAEIDQRKALGYNYNWMDFRDLDKRYTPASTNILLPPTSTNKDLFQYFDSPGTDLSVAREDIVKCELWFDNVKILDGIYNITQYDNGYQGFIRHNLDIINAVNGSTITEILDNSTLTASFATMNAAMSYFRDTSTDGWLIPITYTSDNNTTSAPHYVELEDQLGFNIAHNDIWRSLSKFIEDIETETGVEFYVYQNSGLIDFASSALYTTSRYFYFPVFRYAILYSGSGTVVTTHRGNTQKKGFVYGSKTYQYLNSFEDIGGITTFEFIKLYAKYFNLGIYLDTTNNRIVFIDYTNLYSTITASLDWSSKLVSYKKKLSVSGYEKINFITYPGVGIDIASNVTLANLNAYWLDVIKQLHEINLLYPSFKNVEGIRDNLLDVDYFEHTEYASTPCFLERGSTVSAVIRLNSLTTTVGPDSTIYRLGFETNTARYDFIEDILQIGEEYDAELSINLYDLVQLRPYSIVKIDRLGGLFHINKINSFDPYNNSKATANIVRIA